MSLLYAATAAGTTLTNSTDETSLGSYTFPANFFQAGKVIRFSGLVRTASSNSTDTLVVKVKFGATTLITTAAIDQANGDICSFSGTITCRAAGSSVTVAGNGFYGPADASGTAALEWGAVASSVNTTATIALDVTGTWSVAHADNQCALQALVIEEMI